MAVEIGLEASSSRLRMARKTVTQWLEETIWQSPLGLLAVQEGGSRRIGASCGGAGRDMALLLVQLSSLKTLRQVLLLVGLLEKGARQWDAAAAGEFFEAALGSRPEGKSEVLSADVRLNSKAEVSAKRRKAFQLAIEAGGVPTSALAVENKGVLARDDLIPSSTPNPTPQSRAKRASSRAPDRISDEQAESCARGGSDESSDDSADSSEDDAMTTPPNRRSRPRRTGRGALSAAESEEEEEETYNRRVAKRVRLSPSSRRSRRQR